MLEKIINITAGSDYKHSSKPGQYLKVSHLVNEYHTPGNDSISLSPATGFLAILGWKLKKIKIDKNKIQIGFSFDNLDFSTDLNPNELNQMSSLEYIIRYLLNGYPESSELIVKITSVIDVDSKDANVVKLQFPALKNFFDSIFPEFAYKSNLSAETYEVQKIFSEEENKLADEFNYINKSLIGFLEKYLSTKINLQPNQENRFSKLELTSLQIRK